jgi:urea transporter
LFFSTSADGKAAEPKAAAPKESSWQSESLDPKVEEAVRAAADKETGSFGWFGFALPAEAVHQSLRGMGQVVFCNSVASGTAILGGIFIADPWTGILATAGCVTATLTARMCSDESFTRTISPNLSTVPQPSVAAGLSSYNGALVGCALAVFAPASIATLGSTIVLASGSAAFGELLSRGLAPIPQWTLSFNLLCIPAIGYLAPISGSNLHGDTSALEAVLTPLTGISQIFVQNSPMAGVLILLGIGLYSRQMAMHGFAGSTIGALTYMAMTGDGITPAVCAGLWGYNSALSAMAVSAFFVPNRASLILSPLAAAAAVPVTVACNEMCLSAFAAPALTLPFCAVASATYILPRASFELLPFKLSATPHSPEKNAL